MEDEGLCLFMTVQKSIQLPFLHGLDLILDISRRLYCFTSIWSSICVTDRLLLENFGGTGSTFLQRTRAYVNGKVKSKRDCSNIRF